MPQKTNQLFSASLLEIENLAIPQENEMVFFLMVEGNVTFESQRTGAFQLKTDDIYWLNPREHGCLQSQESNLVLKVSFSKIQIERLLRQTWDGYFTCSIYELRHENEQHQKIRENLIQLVLSHFQQEQHQNPFVVNKYICQLFEFLTDNFSSRAAPAIGYRKTSQNQRIGRILQYIEHHYQESISLQEVAASEDITTPYLSRLFKTHLGVGFVEYVGQVRLNFALHAVQSSHLSMTQIALQSGFPNVKTFNKRFRETYHVTPSAYRKERHPTLNYRDENSSYQEIPPDKAIHALVNYMLRRDIKHYRHSACKTLKLSLQAGTSTEFKIAIKIANIGHAQNGLLSEVQEQLISLKNELGFNLVRFEGLCAEAISDVGSAYYGFAYNDMLFSFLHKNNLNPVIILKLPPEALIESILEKFQAFIDHSLYRYGKAYLSNWYVELHPSPQASVTPQLTSALAWFKKHYPCIRVGVFTGEATTHPANLQNVLELCEQAHHSPDFIAVTGTPRTACELTANDVESPCESIVQFKRSLKARGLAIPIHLCEWNTLSGNGHVLSGTFFRSALIVSSLLKLTGSVDAIGYWVNLLSPGPTDEKNTIGCLSVYLKGLIKRPVYFVLDTLRRISGEVLSSSDQHVLCKHGEQIFLLIFNPCYIKPSQSLDESVLNACNERLDVAIEGLNPGTYLLRQIYSDKDHGGIYNSWLQVAGGLRTLDIETQQYLTQCLLPQFSLKQITVHEQYVIPVNMGINGFHLYTFTPQ